MQEVTLVIKYRTDSYDADKVEAHYPQGYDTQDQALAYDLASMEEGELALPELIDPDSIVSVTSLGITEVK